MTPNAVSQLDDTRVSNFVIRPHDVLRAGGTEGFNNQALNSRLGVAVVSCRAPRGRRDRS
jgi:hypothetical protein